MLHGNNKSEAELARALEVGVGRIVVDSFDEIDRLERLGAEAFVLLRVTPGVEAHTHEYVMTGQEDTKFGFSIASGRGGRGGGAAAGLTRVELRRRPRPHRQPGLPPRLVREGGRGPGAVLRTPRPARAVVGGGLGVAYVEGEEAPTITEWAATIREACSAGGIPAGTRVTAEPGRSIVAAAAITLYTVGTIKGRCPASAPTWPSTAA